MKDYRILVGMSGGVDSSVCALLLQRQGWEVQGLMLDLCSGGAGGSADDARAVAEHLGISFSVHDARAAFSEQVMADFAESYRSGRTPNPCIVCNRRVKFAQMLSAADALGCSHIATGHYARVEFDGAQGRYLLKKGKNLQKDQSYVLYRLTQTQLARTRMPLGEMDSKAAIRALAAEAGLRVAQKKDSQDICFIPDGDYVSFLRRRGVALTPGDFVDETGRVLGRHRGLPCYTTGQRKGLGVGGSAYPLYVLRKDAKTNTVVLGPEEHLYSDRTVIEQCNWIAFDDLTDPVRCTAKTRYSQAEAAATVSPLPGSRAEVVFDAPQRALTAGQSAVFYDGDTVLGGGWICAREEY